MEHDLFITGATIHDGTGAPGVRGDVAIRDGRISAIGRVEGRARRTVEADGLVVCPGFVDIHTHYDAQVLWDRMLTISPWHGVTTVLVGNCGFGVAPTRPEHRALVLRILEKVEGMSFECLSEGLGGDWPFETFPEYMDAIERRGSALNVAAMVGHSPVRLWVMGEESMGRAATPEEVARMRDLVQEAMLAGAIGLATSRSPTHVGAAGRPVPSRLAELDEVRALAGALGELGRGIVQATVGPGLFFDEFAGIAAETGRTITWTALLAGMMGPGSHRMLLERSAELARRGLPIVPQVSCRPLEFDFDFAEPFPFESLPLFGPVSAADREGKKRIYADPSFRAGFRDTLAAKLAGPFCGAFARLRVSSCPGRPDLDERAVEDLAREAGSDPVDFVLDLVLATDMAARFRMAILNFDEAEVAELLVADGVVLGLSDAGAHASQLCDACFSTHLLGHWVRERGVLDLPAAIRLLTSRSAEVVGIEDRGRLAVGLPADVVVFDPDRVGAGALRRVRDLPGGADRLVSDASGIELVVVNGTILRERGVDALDPAGPLPGRLLRGGAARA
ncbi:MAG: N-acyl-D-amino-acid deacylase family protein [Alphaproteobacteria bacterium]